MSTQDRKSLDRYNEKRHFERTPEPRGEHARVNSRKKKQVAARQFVIQKHAARNLHYDFRLELDGTLKSWAVPKGPSLDPAQKRMAVQVEDHPLGYADFEGIIPAGNYGAGTVIVWDQGEWLPLDDDPVQSYAAGRLKFELRGEKLHGRWNLVRMHGRGSEKQPPWLLIKERDDEARPAAEFDIVEALPDSVLKSSRRKKAATHSAQATSTSTAKPQTTKTTKKTAGATSAKIPALPKTARSAEQPLLLAPQLATLVDAAPAGNDWLYEIKFDGYRVLARIDADNEVRLFTRNGNDWTAKLRHLAKALSRCGLGQVWLDGEIVALDRDGNPDFQRLQNAFENQDTGSIQYFVFDLPYCNGHDLSRVPLLQRRELLRALLAGPLDATVQFSENFSVPPEQLLTSACKLGLEGVIGKRRDSHYVSARSRDWIKLKCLQRQEFVIGGFTDSRAVGNRGIGALLLGVYEPDGRLRYAGKVGTGFTVQSLRELQAKLQPIEIDESPFAIFNGRREPAHWVKPKLLAEVVFGEWTDDGHIRHSSFQGLRTDKPARSITREHAQSIERVAGEPTAAPRPKAGAGRKASADTARSGAGRGAAVRTRGTGEGQATIAGIAISHPDRIVDKNSGTSKRQVAEYYAMIARWLLPQLRERPVSLVRAPDGTEGQLFFQKHADARQIPSLRQLDPALMPEHPPLVAIDSVEALVGCAQMNVLEFHTWNARTNTIETPDRMLFDLDPGEGIRWAQIVEAARLLRQMLDALGLRSFLKTSGGKGLHVVVPLTPRDDWDGIKDFSQAIVQHMAATLPQLFVAKSGPKNRVRRIFIDYLRNGRGATTAAAFGLRARPGLGISMPLDWDELDELDSSTHWHIGNVDAAVAAERAKTWSDYGKTRQTITRAQRKLAAINA